MHVHHHPDYTPPRPHTAAACSFAACVVAATTRFVSRLRGTWLRPRLDLYTAFAVCRCTVGHAAAVPCPAVRGHRLASAMDLHPRGTRSKSSPLRVPGAGSEPAPVLPRTRALLQLRCCSSALAALAAACARRPGRCSPPPPPASPAERALRAPVEQRVEVEGARRERLERVSCAALAPARSRRGPRV